jgi:ribosome-associated protein
VTATDRAKQLTIAAAEAASGKLADQIVAFDVSEQLVITDVFMVCSASNDRQVRAIVDAVEEKLHGLGVKPTRREGSSEGRWVLLDYVDIVVHVQHEQERSYYALDRIWADCPTIDLPESVSAGQSDAGGAAR